MEKSKKANKNKNEMNDWISNLAAAATSSESTNIPSKEQRKQKRAAKKARRQQQLDLKRPASSATTTSETALQKRNGKSPVQKKTSTHNIQQSKRRLKQLALVWNALRKEYARDRRPYPREDIAATKSKKKRNRKGWNITTIQPRTNDYSGIGLARDSLYITFDDPSYFPKLEQEFNEHIPGFFGKQRSKAMKRQLDGNMLWRQLAEKKVHMGKKLKGLSPDERVQAMIDAGMI